MAHKTATLGFIGLGVMGVPMASHLLAAGYGLRVHDASALAHQKALEALPGAIACNTPAEVAAGCDIVLTMLPDGEVVRQVALGVDGLHETLVTGSVLLDCTSAQPWHTRETGAALARKGVSMVDAAVSGAQWGAQAAELVFMVGGDGPDVARVRPLLDLMGRAVFHLGALGAGHAMKCINNTITAVTFLATLEGLALGARAGLDPAVMNAVLNESTGQSWITRNHIEQRILSRRFDDPFKLALMLKDVGIAGELAQALGVPLPLAALTRECYAQALAQAPGGEAASVSELGRWVEEKAGAPIVPLA